MKFFLWDFLNCRDLGLWVVLKCKEKESEQGQWAGRRVTDATWGCDESRLEGRMGEAGDQEGQETWGRRSISAVRTF